ncbi:diguanylate cyclase [Erwinia sp. 9145]|uniref:diguanylate cyclase n=1 Tax=Erwinia sp. 9145 TaxID=1500895 RepID=UPI000690C73E|nr:diguanylate cyclase [Erwinia sp. 9145]
MTINAFLSTDRLSPIKRALLPGVLSFGLTLFCLQLIKISGHISPLWFATALMTVMTYRLTPRALPAPLFCCMAGVIGANALVFGLSFANVTFTLINLLHALAGGALLRWLFKDSAPLASLKNWGKMLLSVGLLMPLVSGLVACLLKGDTASFQFFSTWVMSEVVGMLALGPVCLLWNSDPAAKNVNQHALPETLITLVGTLLLNYIALRYLPWPFTVVIVVLFYSAVRLPRFEAFVVFLASLSMMTMLLALHQLNNLVVVTSFMTRAPWLPFLMAIIPSHVMALVMHSFREEKKHIQESETRFRHAIEFSAIGMALVSPEGQWLQVNKALCHLLGYEPEELKKLTFQTLTHPDDLNNDLALRDAVLKGDIETYSLEKRYFRKDGQIVWAQLAVSLVRDNENLPLYFISQIKDVTDLKNSEEENRSLMQRITLANEAGGIGVWDWNLKTGEMNWDKRMFEIYDLPAAGKATYLTWANSLLPDDRQTAIDAFDQAVRNATPIDIQFRIHTESGIRFVRSQSTLVLDEKGGLDRMLGVNQDVSTMQRLTDALYQEKERMHITLDAIGEAVISTDQAMRVMFMNPVAEAMTGWAQEQAEGRPVNDILRITPDSDGPPIDNLLLFEQHDNRSAAGIDQEMVLHNVAGDKFDIHYSIMPLKTQAGEDIGYVLVIQDVSESREMLRRLSYSASHDMLTHLPNRVSFEQQLKQMLTTASDQHLEHALAFIDLDRFKAVNDTAGHAAGDALLREVASVMKHHLRGSDFLARLGGDEFGVLLHSCPPDKAREIISRIIAAVNDYRLLWEGRLHRVGASAGITMFDKDNVMASEIMAQADLACYNAKHNGRGQLSVYEPQFLNTLKPLLSRPDIEQILADQPMRLLVWPVAPPRKTQSVSLCLAEMQLFSAQGEEIEEASFRAGLHDDALFIMLDRKMVREFFQHYASGMVNKALSVVLPLSPQGLRDETLIDEVINNIDRIDLPAQLLHFSIGAEALLTDIDKLSPQVARLREAGCGIVLSDVGRNLDAFNQMPGEMIDYLILNPQMTANVHFNLMDEMMVSIIQGHAQRMHILTIAGPIELPVALNTLANIGVDHAWGEAIMPREPLNALLNTGYFAIK